VHGIINNATSPFDRTFDNAPITTTSPTHSCTHLTCHRQRNNEREQESAETGETEKAAVRTNPKQTQRGSKGERARYARRFFESLSFLTSLLAGYRHNERGETPSPSCFLLHRHNERGETPSRCVSFHTDATRRGKPLLRCVFFHTNTMRGGFTPSRRVSFHTDATRRGKPSLSCFIPRRHDTEGVTLSVVFTQMRRDGGSLFPSCYLQHGRDDLPPAALQIRRGLLSPRHNHLYLFSKYISN